jgi:cytochrome c oxidase subunit 2
VNEPRKEPNHLARIAIGWVILAAIATPIVVAAIAPRLPPYNGSSASSGQVHDNTVLLGIVTPIAALLIVYFAYVLIVFRRRGSEPAEGLADRGDPRVHIPWLAITTLIVIFLAAFGTVGLADSGSGGGQGPIPAFKPDGSSMPVQVIGQQWEFTYRYPTFGGVETAHLELPVGRQVAFHVTSLDVIHSFWAPKLGIKADANPGVDNVAYMTPSKKQVFDIRCSELCGLWHGYMFDHGEVVSDRAFATWIHGQQANYAPIAKQLPPYASHYFPDPQRRGG